ncbi:hypothetical protein BJX70DRAFT_370469 [Aspergillus crustosus]
MLLGLPIQNGFESSMLLLWALEESDLEWNGNWNIKLFFCCCCCWFFCNLDALISIHPVNGPSLVQSFSYPSL